MTPRDRAGDATGQGAGRRGAAGDAGHRQGFPTPSGAHCRFARATGGGFPNALRLGLSGGVARGLRCPASPRHALLAETTNLEAWGKPSQWVITKDLWY